MSKCDCKVGWVDDPDVIGQHSSVPVTCATYTAALEKVVIKYAGEDTLHAIQEACGIRKPPTRDR